MAFLSTNNERSEREIREAILFTIASKRIKFLGISLPKETKDLYSENYKTLMKEIKDDTDGKTYHALDWKSQYYQNDYTTQGNLCNPYQITQDIFHRTQTKYFKVCLEAQKTQNSQRYPEKEKWTWRIQAS